MRAEVGAAVRARRTGQSRHFARLIAEEMAPLVASEVTRILGLRGLVAQAATAPENVDNDSESDERAREILAALRRKKKRAL